MNCFKTGIFLQGLKHDLSKYSICEFVSGVKYYQGDKSPHVMERNINGYSMAWMHHKGRNKHHYEYWVDVNPKSRVYEPVEMPKKYLAEMFCDRVAASRVYNGKNYKKEDSLNYFLRAKNNIRMHENTRRDLEFLLRMCAKDGEDATFKYIKEKLKKEK